MIDGRDVDLLDVMNPAEMFVHGRRHREYSTKDILPLSGKLIPEFDGRRSIRDMFSRKPSLLQQQSKDISFADTALCGLPAYSEPPLKVEQPVQGIHTIAANEPALHNITPKCVRPSDTKRSLGEATNGRPLKRVKSGSTGTGTPATCSKGQQSLMGFFKPKATSSSTTGIASPKTEMQPSQPRWDKITPEPEFPQTAEDIEGGHIPDMCRPKTSPIASTRSTSPLLAEEANRTAETSPSGLGKDTPHSQDIVHDPIESKDSWSKLFTKPPAPRCEGHSEPCVSLVTKKSGINCGRSFWMCARPLGPTGVKERNTQWRCQTFIWCSDWNSILARDSVQEEPLLGSSLLA